MKSLWLEGETFDVSPNWPSLSVSHRNRLVMSSYVKMRENDKEISLLCEPLFTQVSQSYQNMTSSGCIPAIREVQRSTGSNRNNGRPVKRARLMGGGRGDQV